MTDAFYLSFTLHMYTYNKYPVFEDKINSECTSSISKPELCSFKHTVSVLTASNITFLYKP